MPRILTSQWFLVSGALFVNISRINSKLYVRLQDMNKVSTL